ncbi:5'-3' exonuclease [Puniceicoccales bacterium CK1056]|uniref:5'-3' exonuclease n=1 Tax=Oceanipulchritudo coccoides TaxID=2706888 RepID=A0A6B2M2J8_9BACT|nr:5'-3' exonuclease H3TH domain-containing protein [Oceanipulchritudo coccoides]NDV62354.1 5'-3' exonuclease [Oceanipulchritudo coccoides]
MKVVLVDGFNMAFRAYYGMPELTREDGFPTGAVHGWVRTLWWIEDNVKPDNLLVFFDLGGAQRQLAIREDYKANRGEAPEDLEKQIPVIKEWTRAAGYVGIEEHGVEADDLIAAYSVKYAEEGHEVLILSADKDLAQLVTDKVHQLVPPPTANPKLGWRELDPEGVEKKFGVRANQIADYLALIGDTSDNIPGLKGVGPKTAAKWLNQYRTLEEIIAHCGELNPKRFQGLVYAEADNIRRNLEMTKLDRSLSIDIEAHAEPDPERAVSLLKEMEMGRSAEALVKRLETD